MSFVDKGLEFDGAAGEYVSVTGAPTLGANDDFTLMAWVQCAATSTATIQMIVGGRDTTVGALIYFAPRFHENTFSGIYYNGASQYYGALTYTVPTIETAWAGNWLLAGYHVKRDGSQVPLMSVNGVTTPAGGVTTNNAELTLDDFNVGGWPWLGGFPWKGIIGEVYWYNTYKTGAQALELYNATKSRYGL